jgi:hypothetical protein
MREFRDWRAASRELVDIAERTGPRIALAGAVACLMLGVPLALRYLAFLPW